MILPISAGLDYKGKVTVATYPFEKILENIQTSIGQLFKNDAFLLKNTAHERSVTHKFAEYLQLHFPEYHVDCEYDLDGIESKLLPRECNGENREKVVPDIIVHFRGTSNNLLVIEAKLSPALNSCDSQKLQLFTALDGKFKYKFGLAVGFNKLQAPRLTWFTNGEVDLQLMRE